MNIVLLTRWTGIPEVPLLMMAIATTQTPTKGEHFWGLAKNNIENLRGQFIANEWGGHNVKVDMFRVNIPNEDDLVLSFGYVLEGSNQVKSVSYVVSLLKDVPCGRREEWGALLDQMGGYDCFRNMELGLGDAVERLYPGIGGDKAFKEDAFDKVDQGDYRVVRANWIIIRDVLGKESRVVDYEPMDVEIEPVTKWDPDHEYCYELNGEDGSCRILKFIGKINGDSGWYYANQGLFRVIRKEDK